MSTTRMPPRLTRGTSREFTSAIPDYNSCNAILRGRACVSQIAVLTIDFIGFIAPSSTDPSIIKTPDDKRRAFLKRNSFRCFINPKADVLFSAQGRLSIRRVYDNCFFCLAVEVAPSRQRRLRADCEGHQEQPALSNRAFHCSSRRFRCRSSRDPQSQVIIATIAVNGQTRFARCRAAHRKNDRFPERFGRTTGDSEIGLRQCTTIHRLTIGVS